MIARRQQTSYFFSCVEWKENRHGAATPAGVGRGPSVQRKFVCRQDGHPENDRPPFLRRGLWPRLGRDWQCRHQFSGLQWLRRRVLGRRCLRQQQPRHFRRRTTEILPSKRRHWRRPRVSAVRRRVHHGAARRRVHCAVRPGHILLPRRRRRVHPQRRTVPMSRMRHPLQG